MTPEQFTKAEPIINVIKKLDSAISAATKVCRKIEEQPLTGDYQFRLTERKDGSSEYSILILMDGCWVGEAMAFASLKVLKDKKTELEANLAEI